MNFRLACVVLVSALTCGCIKSQQTLTLMPDGSGKIEVAVGFNAKAGQQLNGGLGGPLPGQAGGGLGQKLMTDLDPLKLESMGEGFVAFTKPEKLEVRGWEIVTFTAYFDDINKVKMHNDKERVTEFKLTPKGAGAELTVEKPMLQGMQNDKPRQLGGNNMPPEMREMMTLMLSGLELSETYLMPGKVEKADGLNSIEGRAASLRVVTEDFLEPERQAKLNPIATAPKRTITYGKPSLTAGDINTFKAELKKAKLEWPKIKAELEKQAKSTPKAN